MEPDNTSTATVDNASAQAKATGLEAGPISGAAGAAGVTAWKQSISSPDLRNSLSKFDDTPEGIGKLAESYNNLEKLLGHEKVPIPKDINDVEGWNRLSKALGVPDKAEGYGLADANIPKDLAQMGLTLNKNEFAEVMHAHKVPPSAVKGIWDVYQKKAIDSYAQAMKQHQEQLTNTINALRGEWGDTYETNVELGQMVINKFSNDQEMNDYLTASLSKDPRGIKFLAKVGEQFAENKVPEFQMKRFSLAPEEALEEIQKIKMDMDGPYMNQKGKFTDKEHQAAVDRVNHLFAVYQKGRQG
jgi:hypothetical protein